MGGGSSGGLRGSGGGGGSRGAPSPEAMPKVLDPLLTTPQVRQHAAATLPGARVRRLVFWRYLLIWHRPIDTHSADGGQRTTCWETLHPPPSPPSLSPHRAPRPPPRPP